MKIANPDTEHELERDLQVASLLPREASSIVAYKSNDVESGRVEGLFELDSLFSLRVGRGESVAYYFNATAAADNVPCTDTNDIDNNN